VWPQLCAFALGIWLTAAPGVLGYGGAPAANDHVTGPLAAMFGLVAAFEVTRPVRWVNLLLGLWLVGSVWVLGYRPTELVNATAVGIGLAALACVRGRRGESFGGGWRVLWDSTATRTNQAKRGAA
jgi:hypothetical protein